MKNATRVELASVWGVFRKTKKPRFCEVSAEEVRSGGGMKIIRKPDNKTKVYP